MQACKRIVEAGRRRSIVRWADIQEEEIFAVAQECDLVS